MIYIDQFLGGDSAYAAAAVFVCLLVGYIVWLARTLEASWDLEDGQ